MKSTNKQIEDFAKQFRPGDKVITAGYHPNWDGKELTIYKINESTFEGKKRYYAYFMEGKDRSQNFKILPNIVIKIPLNNIHYEIY